MDQEFWRKVEELFQAALDRVPEERNAFLDDVCGEDADLRQQVELLLAKDAQAKSFLETGPLDEETMPAVTGFVGHQFGPYRIVSLLGAGGMGTVYRALDMRLGRPVAIKISSERFSKRFEREARVISALNHPHICTLYDIGSLPSGASFMVTELVEGETLDEWLRQSPPADRITGVAREILEALRAAHAVDIIHRDLKPANIMIRFDGYVKVLDFGLAKRMAGSSAPTAGEKTRVSAPGLIMGTLAYMSPEQILGQDVDARSDLFAFGIILYEMIAGLHPWRRESPVDTMHAILHDDPPVLQCDWASAIDKLLRKDRQERYASAEEVLQALAMPAPSSVLPKRALTRLIVLPFRILRPHEPSDFLSVSLPDAISSSLVAIDSLIVRSTMVASKLASVESDVKTIAEQAQVDVILTGCILPDGEKLRVTTQLVQAPDGALLWSNTSEASLRDIFRLQDDLVDRIVQSLALPLTAREQRALKHDVPVSALAYEFFLRANQLVANDYSPEKMTLARDLYLQSVEIDPKFAPAWAYLGRAYRFIGKFAVEDLNENFARSEDAFQKAFALNPELAVAHNLYTSLQTDMGQSLDAMKRLLKRGHLHRNDPNLFAGLVHACRYCGLPEASVAAHEAAKRLDANIRTTVQYSYIHLGDFQRVLNYCTGAADYHAQCVALERLDRPQEAIALFLEKEKTAPTKQSLLVVVAQRALLQGDRETSLDAVNQVLQLPGPFTHDPESHWWMARLLTRLNESERALDHLFRGVNRGYCCHYALLHDPWLDSLRSNSRFLDLVSQATAMRLEARAVFLDNGGDRLLGVQIS